MTDDEWVDLSDAPLIADVHWLHAQSNGAPTTEMEDSWQPRNLAELEDKPPVQPTLGGLSLCYPGKRHVFSGPQESAKTLAAYVVGLSVVRSGATVVLIDLEMGPWDAKTRLRELGATQDELAGFLYVEPDTPMVDDAARNLIERAPGLAIVDAAAGAFQLEGYDDNARKDVERWAAKWVTPFWKAGIATIVLDHVTKNVEQRGNYAIGSERKVGGADVHLGFSVVTPIKRGSHGVYKITTHKDRGGCLKRGKLAEFVLESDPDTHAIAWQFVAATEHEEGEQFRPTHLMEKVSRYVETQVEPVSMGDIKNVVTGKTEYVVEAVNLLVDEGYLEETSGARKARMFELILAFREVVDPFPKQRERVEASPIPPPVPDDGIPF